MTTTLLDPTAGGATPARPRVAGYPSLEGRTVGLLDIRKRQGDKLLNRLEELFGERGIRVGRYAKPTFTKHARRKSSTASRPIVMPSSKASPIEVPVRRAVCRTCWTSIEGEFPPWR